MRSYSGAAMRMPSLCPHVPKFIAHHELHEIIHDVVRGFSHRLSITFLPVEKTDAFICIGWMDCELMKTLLGCLDVLKFCFGFVFSSAFCMLPHTFEQIRICQRQLVVRALLDVNQREPSDIL